MQAVNEVLCTTGPKPLSCILSYMEKLSRPALPDEEILLLGVMKGDISHLKLPEKTGAWRALCRLADYHGVLPLLFDISEKMETIDEETFALLREEYREIASLNLTLTAHLLMITKSLEKENLRYIALKGPLLSQELYGDITMRQYSDIDLFVEEQEVRAVSDIILALGYEPILPMELLERRKFFELDNDFSFRHRVSDLKVELHWKLFPRRHRMPLSFTALYDNGRTLLLQKRELVTLSPEDNLLYLTLHGAKHIFERLIWVGDIDRLIRNIPDTILMKSYHKACAGQMEEPFLLGLFLSQKLFETPLPRILERDRTPHVDYLVEKTLEYYRERLLFRDESSKKRARFLFLADLHQKRRSPYLSLLLALFKPAAADVIALQLPDRWDFLYPLIRPFRLILKYFPGSGRDTHTL